MAVHWSAKPVLSIGRQDKAPSAIGRIHELPLALRRYVLSAVSPSGGSAAIEPNLLNSIDWGRIAEEADAHALGVLVYQRLKELDLIRRLPEVVSKAWEADALHARLQAALQRQDALEISRDFHAHGIRHAFMKGLAYRESLYSPGWARIGGDSDLLVDRYNVEFARQRMLDLGFFQASSTIDYRQFHKATPQQLWDTESSHYELGQFVKAYKLVNLPPGIWGKDFVRKVPYIFEKIGNDIICHSVVDIHWALHFAFSREAPLDSLIVNATADGEQLPQLNAVWSLLTTCFKLYFEAFDRVRYGYHHIVDIIALLKLPLTAAHWKDVAELVQKYRLEAAAFYTFSAAETVSGEPLVPFELMNSWSDLVRPYWSQPNSDFENGPMRQELDYGDFFPYLIGYRVPARPLGRS